MLHRRTFVAAFAASLFPLPARAADDPAAPIRAIYKKATGDVGGDFVWFKRADRARHFSRALAAAWDAAEKRTAEGDQTPPGFDPITNSQDPMVRNVRVKVEKSDGKSATVAASFDSWSPGETREEQERNPPDPKARVTVRYDMLRERGRWVIDDIRGTIDGEEWSIKDIMRGWSG